MIPLTVKLEQLFSMDLPSQLQALILALLLGAGVVLAVDKLMFQRADKKAKAKAELKEAKAAAEERYEAAFLAHTITLEDYVHYTKERDDLAALIAKLEAKV